MMRHDAQTRPQRAGAGGASPGGGSAASSAIVHSPSAARIRSRTRHSGSRTLHFANCSQLSFVGRAGGDGDRTVDRLNDVGDRNLRRPARQLIAAARALVRRQQPAPHQPLQHLRHQLDRDVVLLRDLAGARRRRGRPRAPDVSWRSARNPPFSRASALPFEFTIATESEIRPLQSDINISAGWDRPCRSSPGSRPSGSAPS